MHGVVDITTVGRAIELRWDLVHGRVGERDPCELGLQQEKPRKLSDGVYRIVAISEDAADEARSVIACRTA